MRQGDIFRNIRKERGFIRRNSLRVYVQEVHWRLLKRKAVIYRWNYVQKF